MKTYDDGLLVSAYARNRSEEAFRELALRYGSLVYAACLWEVRDPQLAEDAAQAVFLVLARKASRIHVRTSLVPWLYGTSRLVCRGVLRSERRRKRHEGPLEEGVSMPAPLPDDALFQALDRLKTSEREAIVLRFVQGLSLAEVGQVQGLSEDAVRMRIQRALKRLRTEYVAPIAVPLGFLNRLGNLPLPKPIPLFGTPAFLATGGVLVLTALGTTTALHRPQSSLVSGVGAGPILATKAQAGTKTRNPDGIAVLDKPFTLVYRLTIKSLSTQAMIEAEVARYRKEQQKLVDADAITPEQADAAVAKFRGDPNASAPVKEDTISYDGHTLLFQEKPDSGSPDPDVELFDGSYSYHFTPGHKQMWALREDGTVSHWTPFMPLVGFSLPFFPMTNGSKVLDLQAWNSHPTYVPARIEKDRLGRIKRITIGTKNPPGGEILLTGYAPLLHRQVPRSIVNIERDYSPGSVKKGEPRFRLEYALISSIPSAVSPECFDPNHYAEDGILFSAVIGSVQHNFKIDHSKGTLLEQIATAIGGSR